MEALISVSEDASLFWTQVNGEEIGPGITISEAIGRGVEYLHKTGRLEQPILLKLKVEGRR